MTWGQDWLCNGLYHRKKVSLKFYRGSPVRREWAFLALATSKDSLRSTPGSGRCQAGEWGAPAPPAGPPAQTTSEDEGPMGASTAQRTQADFCFPGSFWENHALYRAVYLCHTFGSDKKSTPGSQSTFRNTVTCLFISHKSLAFPISKAFFF